MVNLQQHASVPDHFRRATITACHQRPSPPSPLRSGSPIPPIPPIPPVPRAPPSSPATQFTSALPSFREYQTQHPPESELVSNGTIYSPLSDGEFRLLDVLPAKQTSDDIVCQLRPSAMTRYTRYTAISYAWGDRRDTATIRLILPVTTTMRVTSSLRDALRALRRRSRKVTVWVDALSIDQSNIKELSRQVQIMDRIYKHATRVAIWLGPSSHNSALALDTLSKMAVPESEAGIRTLAKSTSKENLLAIADLFERSYWKRLWIVQEIFYATAKRSKIYCGNRQIAWSEIDQALPLFNTAEWKRAINEVYPPGSNLGRGSQSQYSFAQILATQGPQSLLYQDQTPAPIAVMRHTRSKLAAKPQDKVLGVLSLLGPNIRSSLTPNFNSIPKEAFTEVVRSVIKATGSLDIICEAIRYPFHQEIFDLPSWVADWSHAPDISSLAATNLEHRGPFKASGDLRWPKDTNGHHDRATMSRDEITIDIIPLGTITSRGMAVGSLGRLTNYLMAFLEWRHLLMDKLGVEDQALRQAFCRTLCLGNVPSELYLGPESRELKDGEWAEMTYFLFAMFLSKRLGRLLLDPELERYCKLEPETKESEAREVIQRYFGDRMMGRCFCLLGDTETRMGMGTGYMGIGDLVAVAIGCSTPIILRQTSQDGKFEYIGDIYVDGYMDGEVIEYPVKLSRVILC